MKILNLAFSLCLLGTTAARADLTIVQQVNGMGQAYENTSRFKEGKTRVDTSPGTSLIMDLRTGETISLNHPQKTYLKISGEMAKAALATVQKMQSDQPETHSPLTATGKQENISGYAAEEYTCTIAGVKMALWLTRALPDYEAALKELSAGFNQGAMAATMRSYGFDMSTLPGFPVRTVLEIPPDQTMTRTVVSVSTQPVPEAEFQIPADYKEVAATTLTPPAAAQAVPTP